MPEHVERENAERHRVRQEQEEAGLRLKTIVGMDLGKQMARTSLLIAYLVLIGLLTIACVAAGAFMLLRAQQQFLEPTSFQSKNATYLPSSETTVSGTGASTIFKSRQLATFQKSTSARSNRTYFFLRRETNSSRSRAHMASNISSRVSTSMTREYGWPLMRVSDNRAQLPHHAQDYPGLGALDQDGKPGYIANATSALRAAPVFTAMPADCRKSEESQSLWQQSAADGTWKLIGQHMHLATVPSGGIPRVLCGIYTHKASHESKVRVLRDTWGRDCDGFIAISDKTDPSLGAVHILHKGKESWNNMWQKMRSAWAYFYENYRQEYDWFLIGGDDLFVSVENLKSYLATFDPSKPHYLGRPSKRWRGGQNGGDASRMFNLGGAGYVLSSAALQLLWSKLHECSPNSESSAEDVAVSECLRDQGVVPSVTRDSEGRERFLPFPPEMHLEAKPGSGDWYEQTAIDLKYGFDCCSKEAISFHYVKPLQMRRMYALLHGYCTER